MTVGKSPSLHTLYCIMKSHLQYRSNVIYHSLVRRVSRLLSQVSHLVRRETNELSAWFHLARQMHCAIYIVCRATCINGGNVMYNCPHYITRSYSSIESSFSGSSQYSAAQRHANIKTCSKLIPNSFSSHSVDAVSIHLVNWFCVTQPESHTIYNFIIVTYSEGFMPPLLTSTNPSETMDSVTFSNSSPRRKI